MNIQTLSNSYAGASCPRKRDALSSNECAGTGTEIRGLRTEKQVIETPIRRIVVLCLVLFPLWCCIECGFAQSFDTGADFGLPRRQDAEGVLGFSSAIPPHVAYCFSSDEDMINEGEGHIIPQGMYSPAVQSSWQRGGARNGYEQVATGMFYTPATFSDYPGHYGHHPVLTQVGADRAIPMAWTSESNAAPIRRANDDGWTDLSDPNQSDKSPVGEAWVLLAFAALYGGYTLLRKRKARTDRY